MRNPPTVCGTAVPAQSQVESEPGPVYFVRAPTSDPNVFALKLAEADPTPGYELVARVREFSRGRRDGLVAVLVEGKAIAVARMRAEISNRMQICPDSASREEATRLARVLTGE